MIRFLILLLMIISHCQASDDGVKDFLKMVADIDGQSDDNPSGVDSHIHEKSFHSRSDQKVAKEIKCGLKGKVECSANCLHGKQHFFDGCCQCNCRRNFAAIGSTICRKASWSSWGEWSECIETEWGGLQTKERICRSNGNEAPGACDGRGSIARKCSKEKKAFRIRKNLRNLSDEELHDFIQAMKKFKRDFSKTGYRKIISWHGFPGLCPWYHHLKGHEDDHCSWHHHPLFLPWHRLIIVQLELGLQRYLKNKAFGIPYWDWTEHHLDLPYLIRHRHIYDPILKKYVLNPFHRTFIFRGEEDDNIYTHRNIYYPRVLDDDYLRKGTVMALLSHDFSVFEQNLSDNPHDQIHNCFCYKTPPEQRNIFDDWCSFGMPSVDFASWDPVFLLHHSAMDRIFTIRRYLEEEVGFSDWTRSRVVGEYLRVTPTSSRDIRDAFNWPLSPFCNESMNPEPITRKDGVWTLHNSYYNEQLFGYKYDNFNFGGNYTWDDLKNDFMLSINNSEFWNHELFETKLGKLSAEKICPNEWRNEGDCILKC